MFITGGFLHAGNRKSVKNNTTERLQSNYRFDDIRSEQNLDSESGKSKIFKSINNTTIF